MKQGINVLWIGLVLLCVLVVLLARVDCVQFVTTSIEEPVPSPDGEPYVLPEPIGYDAFEVVWRFSVGCVVVSLFRNVFLNVIGNVLALLQAVLVCFYSQFVNALESGLDEISCGIGRAHGYYESLPMGFVLGGLCILIFVYSVLLTVAEIKTKKERRHSTA